MQFGINIEPCARDEFLDTNHKQSHGTGASLTHTPHFFFVLTVFPVFLQPLRCGRTKKSLVGLSYQTEKVLIQMDNGTFEVLASNSI